MPLIPDIKISVQNQSQLILDPVVKSGQFLRSRNGMLILYAGGFTAVFPVMINGEKWAFRCWHVPITNASKRLKLVSEFILQNRPSYLVPLEYTQRGILVKGEIFPTTRMKWIEGQTLKKYLCANIGKKQSLLDIASAFLSLVEDMHRLGIAHGDLQHGNILVTEKENIYLVDYDSMYVPAMNSDYPDEIVGKEDYQHPNRKNNKISNSKVDYFSELIIYLSILGIAENAQLATKYKLADTEYLLFSASDFKDLERSAIYKDLQGLNIPLIDHLLGLLCKYLKVDDINKLEPFNDNASFKKHLASYYKSEDDLWQELKSENNVEAYQRYLKQYPHGRYSIVARRKLNELIEQQRVLDEENLWKDARRINTLASYCHYISSSTMKIHLSEAKQKVEELRWYLALGRDTVEAYQAYLNETDLGLYRQKAYEKIEVLSWDRACRLKTEHAYRSYLRFSISKKHKFQAYIAINDLYWDKAERRADIEGYNEYLSISNSLLNEVSSSVTPQVKASNTEYKEFIDKISDNQIRVNVRLRTLEEELWSKVSAEDIKSRYEYYVEQFPTGRYVGDCHRRIEALIALENEEALWKKARMSHSLTGYRNYLKDSTLKEHQREALEKIAQYDEEAWQKALSSGTEDRYREYIELFPSGIHVDEANRQIESIRSKANLRKGCGWILAMVIIIGIIVLCIVASSAPSSRSSGNPGPRIEKETSGTSNTVNVSEIESKVYSIIYGAERAKENGDPINYTRLREAERLLNQIQYSSKYNEYKRRINALK